MLGPSILTLPASSPFAAQFKEGRPRNLGRGVSKPKKNTVASLLAQSRAVGSKPLTAQQLLTQEAEIVSSATVLNSVDPD